MSTRPERDSFGLIDVPAQRLWGAQTQRSLHFFSVSTETMPRELLVALVQVKQAAARANAQLGVLDAHKADAIDRAAAEVLANRHDSEFPLSVWQTGSGTQTNMNVNEVLANRASELLGGPRGEGRLVHPNDDVNRSQSSNDVFPTAMHVAAVVALEHSVLPALQRLTAAWQAQRQRWGSLVKLGRTHLQDATPLTVGQEFSGYVAQLEHARRHLEAALPHLRELALGGTAVGTGLNAPKGYAARAIAELSALTGHAFLPAPNRFEALATMDGLVNAHGALKGLAVALFKMASDVRLLASGPRAGLGELRLPENEPGSSIMPGKVNPTQAEMVTMVGAQVLGNDVTVGFAGASGQLELNVFRPVVAHAFLQSARLLAGAMDSFRAHCVEGLEPDVEVLKAQVARSLMLVTALTPHLGYDAAARIAKRAHAEGTTLKAAALALGLLTEAQYDAWVDPEAMARPPDEQ
jgi:fumarate hydratase class II